MLWTEAATTRNCSSIFRAPVAVTCDDHVPGNYQDVMINFYLCHHGCHHQRCHHYVWHWLALTSTDWHAHLHRCLADGRHWILQQSKDSIPDCNWKISGNGKSMDRKWQFRRSCPAMRRLYRYCKHCIYHVCTYNCTPGNLMSDPRILLIEFKKIKEVFSDN